MDEKWHLPIKVLGYALILLAIFCFALRSHHGQKSKTAKAPKVKRKRTKKRREAEQSLTKGACNVSDDSSESENNHSVSRPNSGSRRRRKAQASHQSESLGRHSSTPSGHKNTGGSNQESSIPSEDSLSDVVPKGPAKKEGLGQRLDVRGHNAGKGKGHREYEDIYQERQLFLRQEQIDHNWNIQSGVVSTPDTQSHSEIREQTTSEDSEMSFRSHFKSNPPSSKDRKRLAAATQEKESKESKLIAIEQSSTDSENVKDFIDGSEDNTDQLVTSPAEDVVLSKGAMSLQGNSEISGSTWNPQKGKRAQRSKAQRRPSAAERQKKLTALHNKYGLLEKDQDRGSKTKQGEDFVDSGLIASTTSSVDTETAKSALSDKTSNYVIQESESLFQTEKIDECSTLPIEKESLLTFVPEKVHADSKMEGSITEEFANDEHICSFTDVEFSGTSVDAADELRSDITYTHSQPTNTTAIRSENETPMICSTETLGIDPDNTILKMEVGQKPMETLEQIHFENTMGDLAYTSITSSNQLFSPSDAITYSDSNSVKIYLSSDTVQESPVDPGDHYQEHLMDSLNISSSLDASGTLYNSSGRYSMTSDDNVTLMESGDDTLKSNEHETFNVTMQTKLESKLTTDDNLHVLGTIPSECLPSHIFSKSNHPKETTEMMAQDYSKNKSQERLQKMNHQPKRHTRCLSDSAISSDCTEPDSPRATPMMCLPGDSKHLEATGVNVSGQEVSGKAKKDIAKPDVNFKNDYPIPLPKPQGRFPERNINAILALKSWSVLLSTSEDSIQLNRFGKRCKSLNDISNYTSEDVANRTDKNVYGNVCKTFSPHSQLGSGKTEVCFEIERDLYKENARLQSSVQHLPLKQLDLDILNPAMETGKDIFSNILPTKFEDPIEKPQLYMDPVRSARTLREKSPSESDVTLGASAATDMLERCLSADHALPWMDEVSGSTASDDSIWFLFLNKSAVGSESTTEPTSSVSRKVSRNDDEGSQYKGRSMDSLYSNSNFLDSFKGSLQRQMLLSERSVSLDNIYQVSHMGSQKDALHRSRSADILNAGKMDVDESDDQIFPPKFIVVDMDNVPENDQENYQENDLDNDQEITQYVDDIQRSRAYKTSQKSYEADKDYIPPNEIDLNASFTDDIESSTDESVSSDYSIGEVNSGIPYFKEFTSDRRLEQSESGCQTEQLQLISQEHPDHRDGSITTTPAAFLRRNIPMDKTINEQLKSSVLHMRNDHKNSSQEQQTCLGNSTDQTAIGIAFIGLQDTASQGTQTPYDNPRQFTPSPRLLNIGTASDSFVDEESMTDIPDLSDISTQTSPRNSGKSEKIYIKNSKTQTGSSLDSSLESGKDGNITDMENFNAGVLLSSSMAAPANSSSQMSSFDDSATLSSDGSVVMSSSLTHADLVKINLKSRGVQTSKELFANYKTNLSQRKLNSASNIQYDEMKKHELVDVVCDEVSDPVFPVQDDLSHLHVGDNNFRTSSPISTNLYNRAEKDNDNKLVQTDLSLFPIWQRSSQNVFTSTDDLYDIDFSSIDGIIWPSISYSTWGKASYEPMVSTGLNKSMNTSHVTEEGRTFSQSSQIDSDTSLLNRNTAPLGWSSDRLNGSNELISTGVISEDSRKPPTSYSEAQKSQSNISHDRLRTEFETNNQKSKSGDVSQMGLAEDSLSQKYDSYSGQQSNLIKQSQTVSGKELMRNETEEKHFQSNTNSFSDEALKITREKPTQQEEIILTNVEISDLDVLQTNTLNVTDSDILVGRNSIETTNEISHTSPHSVEDVVSKVDQFSSDPQRTHLQPVSPALANTTNIPTSGDSSSHSEAEITITDVFYLHNKPSDVEPGAQETSTAKHLEGQMDLSLQETTSDSGDSEEEVVITDIIYLQDTIQEIQKPNSPTEAQHLKGSTVEPQHLKGSMVEAKYLKDSTVETKHLKGFTVESNISKGSSTQLLHSNSSISETHNLKDSRVVTQHLEESTEEKHLFKDSNVEAQNPKGSSIDLNANRGSSTQVLHPNSFTVETKHLKDSTVETHQLKDYKIETQHLKGTVVETHLKGSTVKAQHLKGSTVASVLEGSSIQVQHSNSSTIETQYLKDSTVETRHFKESTEEIHHLTDSTVETQHLEGSSVEAQNLKGSIVESNITGDSSIQVLHSYSSTVETHHSKYSTVEALHIEGSTVETHLKGSTVEAQHLKGSTEESNILKGSNIQSQHPYNSTVATQNLKLSTSETQSPKDSSVVTPFKGSTIESQQLIGSTIQAHQIKGSIVEEQPKDFTQFMTQLQTSDNKVSTPVKDKNTSIVSPHHATPSSLKFEERFNKNTRDSKGDTSTPSTSHSMGLGSKVLFAHTNVMNSSQEETTGTGFQVGSNVLSSQIKVSQVERNLLPEEDETSTTIVNETKILYYEETVEDLPETDITSQTHLQAAVNASHSDVVAKETKHSSSQRGKAFEAVHSKDSNESSSDEELVIVETFFGNKTNQSEHDNQYHPYLNIQQRDFQRDDASSQVKVKDRTQEVKTSESTKLSDSEEELVITEVYKINTELQDITLSQDNERQPTTVGSHGDSDTNKETMLEDNIHRNLLSNESLQIDKISIAEGKVVDSIGVARQKDAENTGMLKSLQDSRVPSSLQYIQFNASAYDQADNVSDAQRLLSSVPSSSTQNVHDNQVKSSDVQPILNESAKQQTYNEEYNQNSEEKNPPVSINSLCDDQTGPLSQLIKESHQNLVNVEGFNNFEQNADINSLNETQGTKYSIVETKTSGLGTITLSEQSKEVEQEVYTMESSDHSQLVLADISVTTYNDSIGSNNGQDQASYTALLVHQGLIKDTISLTVGNRGATRNNNSLDMIESEQSPNKFIKKDSQEMADRKVRVGNEESQGISKDENIEMYYQDDQTIKNKNNEGLKLEGSKYEEKLVEHNQVLDIGSQTLTRPRDEPSQKEDVSQDQSILLHVAHRDSVISENNSDLSIEETTGSSSENEIIITEHFKLIAHSPGSEESLSAPDLEKGQNMTELIQVKDSREMFNELMNSSVNETTSYKKDIGNNSSFTSNTEDTNINMVPQQVSVSKESLKHGKFLSSNADSQEETTLLTHSSWNIQDVHEVDERAESKFSKSYEENALAEPTVESLRLNQSMTEKQQARQNKSHDSDEEISVTETFMFGFQASQTQEISQTSQTTVSSNKDKKTDPDLSNKLLQESNEILLLEKSYSEINILVHKSDSDLDQHDKVSVSESLQSDKREIHSQGWLHTGDHPTSFNDSQLENNPTTISIPSQLISVDSTNDVLRQGNHGNASIRQEESSCDIGSLQITKLTPTHKGDNSESVLSQDKDLHENIYSQEFLLHGQGEHKGGEQVNTSNMNIKQTIDIISTPTCEVKSEENSLVKLDDLTNTQTLVSVGIPANIPDELKSVDSFSSNTVKSDHDVNEFPGSNHSTVTDSEAAIRETKADKDNVSSEIIPHSGLNSIGTIRIDADVEQETVKFTMDNTSSLGTKHEDIQSETIFLEERKHSSPTITNEGVHINENNPRSMSYQEEVAVRTEEQRSDMNESNSSASDHLSGLQRATGLSKARFGLIPTGAATIRQQGISPFTFSHPVSETIETIDSSDTVSLMPTTLNKHDTILRNKEPTEVQETNTTSTESNNNDVKELKETKNVLLQPTQGEQSQPNQSVQSVTEVVRGSAQTISLPENKVDDLPESAPNASAAKQSDVLVLEASTQENKGTGISVEPECYPLEPVYALMRSEIKEDKENLRIPNQTANIEEGQAGLDKRGSKVSEQRVGICDNEDGYMHADTNDTVNETLEKDSENLRHSHTFNAMSDDDKIFMGIDSPECNPDQEGNHSSEVSMSHRSKSQEKMSNLRKKKLTFGPIDDGEELAGTKYETPQSEDENTDLILAKNIVLGVLTKAVNVVFHQNYSSVNLDGHFVPSTESSPLLSQVLNNVSGERLLEQGHTTLLQSYAEVRANGQPLKKTRFDHPDAHALSSIQDTFGLHTKDDNCLATPAEESMDNRYVTVDTEYMHELQSFDLSEEKLHYLYGHDKGSLRYELNEKSIEHKAQALDVDGKSKDHDTMSSDVDGKSKDHDTMSLDVDGKSKDHDTMSLDVDGKSKDHDTHLLDVDGKSKDHYTLSLDNDGKSKYHDTMSPDDDGKGKDHDTLSKDVIKKSKDHVAQSLDVDGKSKAHDAQRHNLETKNNDLQSQDSESQRKCYDLESHEKELKTNSKDPSSERQGQETHNTDLSSQKEGHDTCNKNIDSQKEGRDIHSKDLDSQKLGSDSFNEDLDFQKQGFNGDSKDFDIQKKDYDISNKDCTNPTHAVNTYDTDIDNQRYGHDTYNKDPDSERHGHDAFNKYHDSESQSNDAYNKNPDSERQGHDAFNKDHDSERQGHDAFNKDHDSERQSNYAFNKDHDSERQSNDAFNKDHDIERQGHDAFIKDHDSEKQGHDALNKDHDSERQSNDAFNKDHDRERQGHDAFNKDHDSERQSNYAFNKDHDSERQSHDTFNKDIDSQRQNHHAYNKDHDIERQYHESFNKDLDSDIQYHDTYNKDLNSVIQDHESFNKDKNRNQRPDYPEKTHSIVAQELNRDILSTAKDKLVDVQSGPTVGQLHQGSQDTMKQSHSLHPLLKVELPIEETVLLQSDKSNERSLSLDVDEQNRPMLEQGAELSKTDVEANRKVSEGDNQENGLKEKDNQSQLNLVDGQHIDHQKTKPLQRDKITNIIDGYSSSKQLADHSSRTELGDRLSSIEQADQSSRTELAGQSSRNQQADQSSRTEQADQSSSTEQAGQSSRTEQADQPSRTEQADQSSRTEQADQSSSTEQADQSSRTEQADKPSRTEQAGQSSRTEQAGQSSRTEQADQSSSTEQADQSSRTEQAGQPSRTEQADQSSSTEQADQSSRTEQAGQSSRTEQADQSSSTEQANQSSRTEQADQSSRTEQADQSSRTEQADQSSRTEQADHSSRTEQANQSSRTEQADQSSRTEQADQSFRTEQADQSSRTEQADQSSRTEQAGQSSRTEQADQSSRTEQADQSSRTEQAGQSSRTEQADKSSRTEQAGQPYRTEQADQSSRTEQADQSSRTEQAGQSSRTEQADQSSRTEQAGQSSRTEQADKSSRTEQADQSSSTEQAGQSSRTEQADKSSRTEQAGQSSRTEQAGQSSRTEQADQLSTEQGYQSSITQLSDQLTSAQIANQSPIIKLADLSLSTQLAGQSLIAPLADQSPITQPVDQSYIAKLATQTTTKQHLTNKSSPTQLADQSSSTKLADQSSITQLADQSSITQLADQSSTTKLADQSSITQLADQSSITQLADQSSITKLADQSSITQLADQSSISQLADQSSITQLADQISITQLADQSSIPQLADQSSTTKLPDQSSITQLADESSTTQLADQSSITQLADESSTTQLADQSYITQLADQSSTTQLADQSSTTKLADQSSITQLADQSNIIKLANQTIIKQQLADQSSITQLADQSSITQLADQSSITHQLSDKSSITQHQVDDLSITKLYDQSSLSKLSYNSSQVDLDLTLAQQLHYSEVQKENATLDESNKVNVGTLSRNKKRFQDTSSLFNTNILDQSPVMEISVEQFESNEQQAAGQSIEGQKLHQTREDNSLFRTQSSSLQNQLVNENVEKIPPVSFLQSSHQTDPNVGIEIVSSPNNSHTVVHRSVVLKSSHVNGSSNTAVMHPQHAWRMKRMRHDSLPGEPSQDENAKLSVAVAAENATLEAQQTALDNSERSENLRLLSLATDFGRTLKSDDVSVGLPTQSMDDWYTGNSCIHPWESKGIYNFGDSVKKRARSHPRVKNEYEFPEERDTFKLYFERKKVETPKNGEKQNLKVESGYQERPIPDTTTADNSLLFYPDDALDDSLVFPLIGLTSGTNWSDGDTEMPKIILTTEMNQHHVLHEDASDADRLSREIAMSVLDEDQFSLDQYLPVGPSRTGLISPLNEDIKPETDVNNMKNTKDAAVQTVDFNTMPTNGDADVTKSVCVDAQSQVEDIDEEDKKLRERHLEILALAHELLSRSRNSTESKRGVDPELIEQWERESSMVATPPPTPVTSSWERESSMLATPPPTPITISDSVSSLTPTGPQKSQQSHIKSISNFEELHEELQQYDNLGGELSYRREETLVHFPAVLFKGNRSALLISYGPVVQEPSTNQSTATGNGVSPLISPDERQWTGRGELAFKRDEKLQEYASFIQPLRSLEYGSSINIQPSDPYGPGDTRSQQNLSRSPYMDNVNLPEMMLTSRESDAGSISHHGRNAGSISHHGSNVGSISHHGSNAGSISHHGSNAGSISHHGNASDTSEQSARHSVYPYQPSTTEATEETNRSNSNFNGNFSSDSSNTTKYFDDAASFDRERSPLSRHPYYSDPRYMTISNDQILNEIEKLKSEHSKMMNLLERSREKKFMKQKKRLAGHVYGSPSLYLESDSSSGESPITVIPRNHSAPGSTGISPLTENFRSTSPPLIVGREVDHTTTGQSSRVRPIGVKDCSANTEADQSLNTQSDAKTSFMNGSLKSNSQVSSNYKFSVDMSSQTSRAQLVDKCIGDKLSKVNTSLQTESTSVNSLTNMTQDQSAFVPATRSKVHKGSNTSDTHGTLERYSHDIVFDSIEVSSRDSTEDSSSNTSRTFMVSPLTLQDILDDDVDSAFSMSSLNTGRAMTSTGVGARVDNLDDYTQTDFARMVNRSTNSSTDNVQHMNTSQSSDKDSMSTIHRQLDKLHNERIEIIELLSLHYLPASLTIELLEAKLNYCIGQTDYLLSTLEDAWSKEDSQPPRSKTLIKVTKEYLEEYKSQLSRSKKDIESCLETHDRKKGGVRGRRKTRGTDFLSMKRRAEIEAFKLERLREQYRHEREKVKIPARHHLSSSLESLSTNGSQYGDTTGHKLMTPSQRRQYLLDLRRDIIGESTRGDNRHHSLSSHSSQTGYSGYNLRSSSCSPTRSETSSYHVPDLTLRRSFPSSERRLHSTERSVDEALRNLSSDLRTNVMASYSSKNLNPDRLIEESNEIRRQNQIQIEKAQEVLRELDERRQKTSRSKMNLKSQDYHLPPQAHSTPNYKRSTSAKRNTLSQSTRLPYAEYARDYLIRGQHRLNTGPSYGVAAGSPSPVRGGHVTSPYECPHSHSSSFTLSASQSPIRSGHMTSPHACPHNHSPSYSSSAWERTTSHSYEPCPHDVSTSSYSRPTSGFSPVPLLSKSAVPRSPVLCPHSTSSSTLYKSWSANSSHNSPHGPILPSNFSHDSFDKSAGHPLAGHSQQNTSMFSSRTETSETFSKQETTRQSESKVEETETRQSESKVEETETNLLTSQSNKTSDNQPDMENSQHDHETE